MASQTMTEAATSTSTATTQSSIRNAMSFSNLLAEPAPLKSSSSPVTTDTPALEPPSTPERSSSPIKEDPTSPANTVMSNATEVAADEAVEEATGAATIADDDDKIKREFTCMNDEYTTCRTGQYTKALSRKVISDHFGRNKACTRDITEWPLFCRKHYQRATYNKELWQIRKVKLILRQFDVIEAEFPGTTYDITLKKSEEDRLNEFSRKIAGGMSAVDAAAAVAPVPDRAFEAPIDVLRELDQYIGKDKTMQDVKDAMDVILQMLQAKETEQVPSIEFLPQFPGKAPSPKKTPAKTRAPKSPSKSPGKGSPRTSARGAVKKTTQKA